MVKYLEDAKRNFRVLSRKSARPEAKGAVLAVGLSPGVFNRILVPQQYE